MSSASSRLSTPVRAAGAVLLAGICSMAIAAQTTQTPPATTGAAARPGPSGKVDVIKVHGRSLEGNLSGDSPDRVVSVYLPPSYATDRNRRYPVLYLLHGFTKC
jgi:S-formylglutathione hydrolase